MDEIDKKIEWIGFNWYYLNSKLVCNKMLIGFFRYKGLV